MKEVLDVDDNEIKEVLDLHKQTLNEHDKKLNEHETKIINHDKQITELQMKDIGFEGRFNNLDTQMNEIKSTLVRMENNNLQSSTLLLNALTTIATGNAKSTNEIAKSEAKGEKEIKKIRLNNNTKVVLKVLAVVSLLISTFMAGKYGISVK